MNPQGPHREKIARIWSEHRGRYLILRLRWVSSETSSTRQRILFLQAMEEID